MKHFKNVLIVVNENDVNLDNPAVVRGIELAGLCDARFTLMGVINPPNSTLSQYKGIFKPKELVAMLTERMEKSLGTLAEQMHGAAEVAVKVVAGKDFIEIVRQVVYEKHDLLIKVANHHERSFDSSDFHLMRKCPAPVWLHKPASLSGQHKVLAAIDLDQENDDEGRELNARILDFASSIAEWEEAELHLLSCWSLYGENSLRDSAFIKVSDDELSDLLVDVEASYLEKQEDLKERFLTAGSTNHLIKGNPTEIIPTFAKEQGIDTVVMGTLARSGIPGLLIGNTAETILNEIDSSVVTLKPSGFESIIK